MKTHLYGIYPLSSINNNPLHIILTNLNLPKIPYTIQVNEYITNTEIIFQYCRREKRIFDENGADMGVQAYAFQKLMDREMVPKVLRRKD